MVIRKTFCAGIEILLEWGDNSTFRVLLFCAKCHFKDEIVTTSAFIFCTTHFSPISTQDPQFMSHDAKIGHSQFTHICYTGTLVIIFASSSALFSIRDSKIRAFNWIENELVAKLLRAGNVLEQVELNRLIIRQEFAI